MRPQEKVLGEAVGELVRGCRRDGRGADQEQQRHCLYFPVGHLRQWPGWTLAPCRDGVLLGAGWDLIHLGFSWTRPLTSPGTTGLL